MEMIVRMIPKSIWNHVNGLLGTGEFELIGTTICKKSIDASVRLDITKAANDPIANRDVKIANIEENTAAIITSDTTPVEENTTPAE